MRRVLVGLLLLPIAVWRAFSNCVGDVHDELVLLLEEVGL